MKYLVLITTILLTTLLVTSQEQNYWKTDSTSSFINPHSPYTDAISLWVMRQNLTSNAYQALINSEMNFDNPGLENTDNTVELFLPLFKKGKLSAMLGTGFSRHHFMSDYDSLNEPIMRFEQFWLPIQYNTKRWKYMIMYERFLAGKPENLFDALGNTERVFTTVSHAINHKWTATLFGVYIGITDEEEKNKTFNPAFQLRYKPNNKLIIAGGAPLLLGVEWSVSDRLDFYFSQIMLDETSSFLCFNFTQKLGLSLAYTNINQGTDKYFNSKSITLNQNMYSFNNINQRQSNIALKLGLKVFDDIGLVFYGGYKMGDKLHLYKNHNEVTTVDGNSTFFAGFNVQYFKYF